MGRRNRDAPGGNAAPFFIGFGVAIIISTPAPLARAGLNPARDLGPRISDALGGPCPMPGSSRCL